MLESIREWTFFLTKRLTILVLSLILVSMITFAVTHFIGNPVYLLVGPRHTQQMLDNMVRELGLDKPLWQQYLNYASNLLHGNLGTSRYSYNPVMDDIRAKIAMKQITRLFSASCGRSRRVFSLECVQTAYFLIWPISLLEPACRCPVFGWDCC